jgi:hypothetical protein
LEAIHRHHYLYQSFKLQNILIASDESGMKVLHLPSIDIQIDELCISECEENHQPRHLLFASK